MCQLCDEADAYLAQLDAASKRANEQQRTETEGKDLPPTDLELTRKEPR